MSTNNYIAKLKARLDQAIIQRDHWKQVAAKRDYIVVTEVDPDSRSILEHKIDADNVRCMWARLRDYDALQAELAALKAQQECGYPECDYCGVTPDHHPWHGSGMLNGAESRHIHACDACRHKLPLAQQVGREPVAWLSPDGRTAYGEDDASKLPYNYRITLRPLQLLHEPAPAQDVAGLLEWAVDRWHAEVANRPLSNVHRRSLDDTWRQVIRRLGGDAGLLCGPAHDALAAHDKQSGEKKS